MFCTNCEQRLCDFHVEYHTGCPKEDLMPIAEMEAYLDTFYVETKAVN